MSQDNSLNDRVKAGTEAHRDRAFGVVTLSVASPDTATITLADHSDWVLAAGDASVYRPLIEFSIHNRKPILLAVDKGSRRIGIIFSTILGTPELNGQSADGTQIQVSVPPSPRVFRLRKDRPWFDAVKSAIIQAEHTNDPNKPHKLWIAFDSVTSEVVDVRPAANLLP